MKDRSDDPSHHERTLLPRSYISLQEWSRTTKSKSPRHPTTLNTRPLRRGGRVGLPQIIQVKNQIVQVKNQIVQVKNQIVQVKNQIVQVKTQELSSNQMHFCQPTGVFVFRFWESSCFSPPPPPSLGVIRP